MLKPKALLNILFVFLLLSAKKASAGQAHTFQANKEGGKLEYQISLPKDTFFIYEGVSGNVKVKNISSKPIPFEAPWWVSDDWVIIDHNGISYSSKEAIHRVVPLDWEMPKLKPKDSTEWITGLSDQGTWDTTSLYPSIFFPVGKYTARYPPDTIPFTFYVVEPTGEESEALKVFLDAFYPKRRDVLWKLPREERPPLIKESAERFLEMANRYPKSIYAYQALSRAAISFWGTLHDHDRWYQITQRIIREYPSAGWGQISSLRIYYQEKNNFSGYKNELKDIVKRKDHPKLTETAKKALKNAKKEFYNYDQKKKKTTVDNLKSSSQ